MLYASPVYLGYSMGTRNAYSARTMHYLEGQSSSILSPDLPTSHSMTRFLRGSGTKSLFRVQVLTLVKKHLNWALVTHFDFAGVGSPVD